MYDSGCSMFCLFRPFALRTPFIIKDCNPLCCVNILAITLLSEYGMVRNTKPCVFAIMVGC